MDFPPHGFFCVICRRCVFFISIPAALLAGAENSSRNRGALIWINARTAPPGIGAVSRIWAEKSPEFDGSALRDLPDGVSEGENKFPAAGDLFMSGKFIGEGENARTSLCAINFAD